MAQLSSRSPWEIHENAALWQERLWGGMHSVFDIIDEADQARLIAISCWLFDIAAALAFPAISGNTLDMCSIVFKILCGEGFAGFEKNSKFCAQYFACAWVLCILDTLLCLFE